MTKRRVFIHAHIQKNGGTTIQHVFEQNFGPRYRGEYGFLAHQYSPKQIAEIVDSFPHLRAVSGHVFTAHVPYDHPEAEVICLAFIRDPIDRFRSIYDFFRVYPELPNHLCKELNFEQWVELFETRYNDLLDDAVPHTFPKHTVSQVWSLIGPNRNGQEAFDQIESYLATGRLLLLPLDRFDEALVLLHQRYPEDFRDCSYGSPKNAVKTHQPLDEPMRQRIEALPNMAQDRALHDMAHRQLDQRIADVFPRHDELGAALATLRKANTRRSRASHRLIYRVRRKAVTLAHRFAIDP